MNQKLIVRILALLLVLAMVLGMIPLVFADEGNLGSGTPDGEPPVLIGMELSRTTVSAPNTIEVTAEATDDVSGASYLHMEFYCEETGKYIYGDANATYYDETSKKEVPFPDGKLHGQIWIDQYLESGTFVLRRIYVSDFARNEMCYRYNNDEYDPGPNYAPIPDFVTQREIQIVANDAPDGSAPILTNLTLKTTDITASGTIEVTAEASDDVSGVSYLHMEFYCEETGKYIYGDAYATYYDETTKKEVPYPDGKLHGQIWIDPYLESGTFVLRRIYISDLARNEMCYRYNNDEYDPGPNYAPIPDFVTQREIRVTDSGTPDGTPPVLTGIHLAATTVAAPSSIEVTAEASDDVSGVSYLHMEFYCEETGKYIYGDAYATYYDETTKKEVPFPDGKLHGQIWIDQYLESGSFVLRRIYVSDLARNEMCYRYNNDEYDPGPNYASIPDFVTQREINVLNAIPDVTTSVSKGEFVDQIKDSADDAYIVADYSGEATLPETAFDAISGTDKTLDLVSEGVTWRFNGNDIVNDSKPIDLNVQITKLEENDSAEIQEKLDETPAVVMKFAENGVLPGKATIQVKVDYAMREYLGASRELCVYYFNNQTGELELIAENLMVINDTYVEFPITHCSYYILSTKIEQPEEETHGYAYGDVNHDGDVKISDAILVMKYRAGNLSEGDTFCERCSNVKGEGAINIQSAILIMKKRANKNMLFPVEMQ